MSIKLGHQEMISSIEHYTKHYTIIKGYCDIKFEIQQNIRNSQNYQVVDNNYWIVLGNISDDAIVDIFIDTTFNEQDGITREGVYEYTACLYYSSSTWEDPSESYIDYIEFQFIETFEARERDLKLNQILDIDLF